MTARTIIELLAIRHSKDVFVDECKDGPTHSASHRRLDAWAMARSWARPAYDGYEVKVSRGDWLRDTKLEDYGPMCNRLWVVAPAGVLEVEELPAYVGYLQVASTGNRLFTRRKAVYREIEVPHDVLRYVLMCRCRVGREYVDLRTREERAAVWRERLEAKTAFRDLGYSVSRRLREETVERVEKAEARVREAEARASDLEEAAAVLRELGIKGSWDLRGSVRRALDVALPLRDTLRSALRELEKLETKS